MGHFKNYHLQGMKKLGTCPAARKFQHLPRMISRLVHGNEVEFHAQNENLNFMPGMKSDHIEATARKRGCISCPAYEIGGNLNFIAAKKISIWLISCLAEHEFRSQPISCGAGSLVLPYLQLKIRTFSVGKFIKWPSDCIMQSSWLRFSVTGDLIAIL